MDPLTASVFVGLLANSLYSLILSTRDKVGDLAFREEDINERILRNKNSFTLIIKEAFKDLPHVIEPEEFCNFLNLDQTKDIIERIYSFDGSDFENPYNLEPIRVDFSYFLSQYFKGREGVSDVAPNLFFILINCCQRSLETIIKEEQDLFAIDAKLTCSLKNYAAVLSNYHENLYQEMKANQASLDNLHIKFDEFGHKFEKGLNDLPQRIKSELQVCSSACNYINMAPDREANFIQRDSEYNKLVEYLLNNQSDNPVAITTALRGAGGFGKTTLAKAVCHEPEIIEKFSDGILWVTLGENPGDIIPQVADLISFLGGEKKGYGKIESAIADLRNLIREKRLLIVIDDVWNSAHLEPFLHGGPYCAHLITTRNDDTLPPKTLKVPVDSMLEKEAVEMLKCGPPPENEVRFNELAERLGYWPLLLKLVNSTLQYHVNELEESIDQALDFVNDGLNEEGLTAFDKEKPESRSQAVEATFAVSLKALTEDECARYHELAIFPEDINIPLKVLEKLWGKTGNYTPYRVKHLCTKLYSMSLLQTYDPRGDFIKLHDVVRKYLMNKQKEKLPLLHSQFLEAFRIERWDDLPLTEIYLWRYLSYHLVRAGRDTELRKLLLDFNWQQSKLKATDVHLLLNDYDLFPEDYPVEMVKGAIRLSANVLSMDKVLLAGQLTGRLQSFSDAEIKSMMKQIWEHSGDRLLPLTGSLMPPGGPLIRTLTGHSSGVRAVSVTQDGKYAISASSDNTLKVWDLKTGKEVHTLIGHSSGVRAVSVTQDGKYAVSASSDNTLKVWNLKTGKEVHTLIGHSSGINAVSVTQDGKYAVSASDDNTLKVWNLKTGKEVHTLIGHSSGINTVSVTQDGKYAVSASDDNTLKVWDLKTGKEVHTLIGHSSGINAVSVTQDGKYAVSASDDNTLKVWDLKTGKEVHTLTGHSHLVNAVSVTQDGKYAVSASDDNTLKVWDLKTGKEVHTLTGHSHLVNAVSVTQDGKYTVSTSFDGTLKVWDLKTGKEVHTLIGHSSGVNAVSVTQDGKYVVSASSDGTLKVWDLKTGKEVHTLTGHSHLVNVVSVTQDGKYAVSTSFDRTLKVWDLKTGKVVHTLIGHSYSVNAVSVTQDGKYAVSASFDGTLKVWDLKTGKVVHTLIGHSSGVNAVSVTQDGKYAVSASFDGTLKVWDLKTGKEVHTLIGHSYSVKAVSVTQDGKYAVSASDDNTLKVWDLKTGKEVVAFGCDSPSRCIVFSPDSTTIVAGERSGRVHFLLFRRETP